ncbi:mechanosensitive ion channel family protein [Terrimonas rubra]|uniref:Mechanosensitive ion channel family protein n=1 Tax=Terrimonas rubra TaxID=1035890 RepID=A0ABW6A0U6_9BACT
MNDFLNQVWFENTVQSYFIVILVILVMLGIKKYVAHYVANLLFLGVHQIWKDVDKPSFKSLVAKPLSMFLFLFVTIVSLDKLTYPEVLNFKIYRIDFHGLLETIATILLIVSFFRLIISIVNFVALILHRKAERTVDPTDDQLIIFFKEFFRVLIGIIGLLMILKYAFGYQISNLLTGLSIVGAAVALALRESLENLIASFIIFFDKPFHVGDVVKVNTFTGTVEKIGLRSVRIRTDQKTFITVPNKQMVDTIIDNLSMRTQRRADLRLEIGLSATAEQLDKFVSEVRRVITQGDIQNSSAYLTDITPSSYLVAVEYYTGPITMTDFNTLKQQINLQVLQLVQDLGMEISGGSTDISIRQPNPPAAKTEQKEL